MANNPSILMRVNNYMSSISRGAINYLIEFLRLQLITTTLSLPLLVAWGLPLSLATCVGNLLFMPFLMMVIIIGSCILMTAVAGIPNTILINIITTIIEWWHFLIRLGSPHWLIGYKYSGIIITFLCTAGAAFSINKINKLTNKIKHLVALILCFLTIHAILKIAPYLISQHDFLSIPALEIVESSQGLTITDKGFFSRCMNPEQAVIYTLRPTLFKRFGHCQVETLILNSLNKRSLEGIEAVCSYCLVKTIKIPPIPKKLPTHLHHLLVKIYQYASSHAISIESSKSNNSKRRNGSHKLIT